MWSDIETNLPLPFKALDKSKNNKIEMQNIFFIWLWIGFSCCNFFGQIFDSIESVSEFFDLLRKTFERSSKKNKNKISPATFENEVLKLPSSYKTNWKESPKPNQIVNTYNILNVKNRKMI